jgi:large subunit ribosomal protein L19
MPVKRAGAQPESKSGPAPVAFPQKNHDIAGNALIFAMRGGRRGALPRADHEMDDKLIKALEREANPNVPDLNPGDSVRVHQLIVEGDRERVQVFPGTVIRIKRGGNNASFTVRRTAAHGIGVERTFLLRSPRLEKVEVVRHAHVRRARLYYLRERTGRRAQLREKRRVRKEEA